jgi:pimeloyl-ACP methyl ester carboxylesterase
LSGQAIAAEGGTVPLVFVHGVNTRNDTDGRKYEQAEEFRNALFRAFLLAAVSRNPSSAHIANPYWGQHAAAFAWKLASLPERGVEALGGGHDAELAELLASRPVPDRVLLQLARQESLADAVDAMWAACRFEIDRSDADHLAQLGVVAADYAQANPQPGWLDAVRDDEQFLWGLARELDGQVPAGTEQLDDVWEALGSSGMRSWTWDRLWEARQRVAAAAGRALTEPALGLVRSSLTGSFATFVGDVLVYLKERGTPDRPGPIVGEIVAALDTARAAAQPGDDKLIVVGHSMGGNIGYDILTSFRTDIRVDALVTVGSQVGLFEELKLFTASDPAVTGPNGSVAKPANVGLWINVFDPADALGFATEPIFRDVSDYSFSTGKPLRAHGAYLYHLSFHRRLADRLRGAWP